MKIVTWNCNGALRNKTAYVDVLGADILVIQECENPSQSTEDYRQWAGDYLWVGESKNKGIGVFARNGNRIRALNWQEEYKLDCIKNQSQSPAWNGEHPQSFLPCKVNDTFTLVGIWTKKADSLNSSYIGQMWKYLQIHKSKLSGDNMILCGDLNSNSIWDRLDRLRNHTDVVRELKEIGIHSLYHHIENEDQGKETKSTFYMYRNQNKSYHIDYVFLSKNLLSSSSLRICEPQPWIECSDHVPLIFTING